MGLPCRRYCAVGVRSPARLGLRRRSAMRASAAPTSLAGRSPGRTRARTHRRCHRLASARSVSTAGAEPARCESVLMSWSPRLLLRSQYPPAPVTSAAAAAMLAPRAFIRSPRQLHHAGTGWRCSGWQEEVSGKGGTDDHQRRVRGRAVDCLRRRARRDLYPPAQLRSRQRTASSAVSPASCCRRRPADPHPAGPKTEGEA